MHSEIHLPGECANLPKWRLLLLLLEGIHARFLGVGGSQVILSVVTAVSRLEDGLTPPSPGSLMAQCADWILWGKNKVSHQSLKLPQI